MIAMTFEVPMRLYPDGKQDSLKWPPQVPWEGETHRLLSDLVPGPATLLPCE